MIKKEPIPSHIKNSDGTFDLIKKVADEYFQIGINGVIDEAVRATIIEGEVGDCPQPFIFMSDYMNMDGGGI